MGHFGEGIMNIPYFYCTHPKCLDPADFLIPMGKSLMGACEDHFRIFEYSFPGAAAQAETLREGSRLPADYKPIVQQKTTRTEMPGAVKKYYTVPRIVGGELK